MRTPLALLLIVAGMLALASAVAAKGPSKVQVCGRSDCTTIRSADRDLHVLLNAGLPSKPPRAAAPWYSIRVSMRHPDEAGLEPSTSTNVYVPSAQRLRMRSEGGGVEWFEVSDGYAAIIQKVASGLDPHPASRLRGLDARPPEGRVVEVVTPAPPGPFGAAESSGGAPWGWVAAALAAASGLVALTARRLRRRAAVTPDAAARGGAP